METLLFARVSSRTNWRLFYVTLQDINVFFVHLGLLFNTNSSKNDKEEETGSLEEVKWTQKKLGRS